MKRFLLGSVAPVWNTGEPAGGPPPQQQQGDWKAPDGTPQEFVGKDAAETLGKMIAGYGDLNTRFEGMRADLSRRPAPGKSVDEYTFAPDDSLKPFFPDVAKDPILPLARQAFLDAGVAPAAFQPIIASIYSKGIATGVIQAPYDPATELQRYGEVNGITDKAIVGQHLAEAEQFATGLAGQLKVPEALKADVSATLLALTDTAAGNTILRALHGRLNEAGIRIPIDSSGANQGELTDDEAKNLGRDPRIDPRNANHPDMAKRFDPALRQRYDTAMTRIGRKQRGG